MSCPGNAPLEKTCSSPNLWEQWEQWEQVGPKANKPRQIKDLGGSRILPPSGNAGGNVRRTRGKANQLE